MNKEKLRKAKELDCKIDDLKSKINKIDDIKNDSRTICVTNYNCSAAIVVPPELENIFISSVRNYYEEKLKKLEQEFEEM